MNFHQRSWLAAMGTKHPDVRGLRGVSIGKSPRLFLQFLDNCQSRTLLNQ
jgi:hypothetical protein